MPSPPRSQRLRRAGSRCRRMLAVEGRGAVEQLAHRYDRAAVDAAVIGATSSGPTFSAAQAGLAVDRRTMAGALAQVIARRHARAVDAAHAPGRAGAHGRTRSAR